MTAQNANVTLSAHSKQTPTASNVGFNSLAEQLTPTILRQPLWLALVGALLSPVKSIGNRFTVFKAQKVQRMSYNGQVRLLENIINRLMLGYYNVDDPVIYLDEPEPIEDFMISPSGAWVEQDSIHYDPSGKQDWDTQNQDPSEPPEDYSIFKDRTGADLGCVFEVHLTQRLSPSASPNSARTLYQSHGGILALQQVVDTYKLAGKRYVVIQD